MRPACVFMSPAFWICVHLTYQLCVVCPSVDAAVSTAAETDLRRLEAKCSDQTVRSAVETLIGLMSGTRARFCPAVFDGFACWPRTPPGAEARLPCPAGTFSGGSFAWRRCRPDGRWEFPETETVVASNRSNAEAAIMIDSSYSNYSWCRPSEAHDSLAEQLKVTQVSKLRQYQRLELENRTCQALMAAAAAANATGCPPTFDNAICWPGAQPGSRVFMSCPDYVNELNRRGLAWRRCLPDGSWHRPAGKPGSGEGWTNFTDCSLRVIHSIGHIGYGISLVFLLLAIGILAVFRRLHCQKNCIHINLFVAFALRAVSHFLNYFVVVDNVVVICRSHQSLLTYSVIASFTWVFVEALHLYMLIFVNTMSSSKMSAGSYMIIGWGAPCLFTGIWVALRLRLDNRECWRKYMPMGADIWLVNVYLCLLVFVNAGLFARIVRELFVKMRNQPRTSAASQNYRKLWKSTSVLVVVFGIYYLIFLPLSMIPKDKLGATLDYIKLAYEHFFNSFQGFFVSLLFCFVNSDVLKELKRHLLETKLGRWLKQRGFIQPLQDVYGLEPQNRRQNRRTRTRPGNGADDQNLPLKTQCDAAAVS